VYNILYFTVPGEVVNLSVSPSSHDVIVKWEKPSYNGECVTRYEIFWKHAGNEQNGSNSTTGEVYSLVIESLDACVQYDISVSAVNVNDERNVTAVSVKTDTDGK
jgi:hypothetical protein